MSKQVQIRRGTTAEHATFTGAVGEITVDTDKETVVVHDGATAGGFPLARSSGQTFTGTITLPSTTSIGNVSSTEIGYLDGVTSAVQTQINAKAGTSSPTFTGTVTIPTVEVTKTQEVFQTLTHSGSGTLSINFDSGNVIYLNQGANITGFTLTNIPSGKAFSFSITRKNTAGSSLTITWGSAFKWPTGGTAPTLTNTLNAIDVFTFITFDGGTTIYSVASGTNFA